MTTPDPSIVAAAQAAQARWGIPASISLAQFGLESGWGAHMPHGSNNPFGIKALLGQRLVTVPTREFVHGRYVTIQAPFRVFTNLAEAFDAHAKLLAEKGAYAHARSLLPDVEAFSNALTGVYATDPHYGESLITIIHGGGLTRYDQPGERA